MTRREWAGTTRSGSRGRCERAVARVVPIDLTAGDATLEEALTVWCDNAPGDHAFADDLDGVGASDRPPTNRWES